MSPKVYLAGPISGKTLDEAWQWRNDFELRFRVSSGIDFLSPLRGNAHLADKGVIHSGEYPEDPTTTAKGATRRDMRDVLASSCVVVNLLNTTRVSIGSVMEIAWAYQARIPLIVIMEKDNLHRHMMIDEAAMYIVESEAEAARLVKLLLNV